MHLQAILTRTARIQPRTLIFIVVMVVLLGYVLGPYLIFSDFFSDRGASLEELARNPPKYLVIANNCRQGLFGWLLRTFKSWPAGDEIDPEKLPVPFHRLFCDVGLRGYDCKDEAAYYLDFFANTYDNPAAEVYIFVHDHERAWHYDSPIQDIVTQLIGSEAAYVQSRDFGGLSCCWLDMDSYVPGSYEYRNWQRLVTGTSFASGLAHFGLNFTSSLPCCGTFWVRASAIRRVPKVDWVRLRENLLDWARAEPVVHQMRKCGAYFERAWHLLLANRTHIDRPPYCLTS